MGIDQCINSQVGFETKAVSFVLYSLIICYYENCCATIIDNKIARPTLDTVE